jgi:hypothetical protein
MPGQCIQLRKYQEAKNHYLSRILGIINKRIQWLPEDSQDCTKDNLTSGLNTRKEYQAIV